MAIQRNNPGNIRRVQGKPWVGEIVPSPFVAGFVEFDTLTHGYRAVLVLLNTYIKNGYNTINKIISRWAPPSENDTANYINFVSTYTNISPATVVKENSYEAYKIALAISEMEQAGTIQASDIAALNEAYAIVTTGGSVTPPPSQSASMSPVWILTGIVGLMLFNENRRNKKSGNYHQ